MAAPGDADSASYAEALRKSLITGLFEGEEFGDEGTDADDADYSIGDMTLGGSSELSLLGVEKDLEEFADHEVIRGILEHGRVLKEYTRDVDDKLRQAELESIQDYIQESDSMVALHDQIKNCDGILAGMEQLLGKFQGDLGRVSEEIRQLQVQSSSMSTKLSNRRAAEQKLGTFVESITISEDLVTNVLEHEINEDYLEYLLLLDKKLKFAATDQIAAGSQAKRDLDPALQKLRIKALVKVRDFLMSKIYQLKRPKTNVQIIQQSVLLKYKHFCRFLRQHDHDMYEEIRGEYISVLSKILAAHFRTYLTSVEKMQMSIVGPADVLGAPEGGGAASNVLSLFKHQATKATTERMFKLGDRTAVLGITSQPAMIPHMAEFEGKKFPYEVIFRNVHKLLMDTAVSEFFFALDFFEDESVFKELALPIVAVVEAELASAVQDLWDMLSLLLMIRVNHDHRKAMTRKKTPCLDDYLDRVHLLLWPRFKVLFDGQLNSIRAGAEKTLFTDNATSPHYVTRRYAALTASMLVLMAEFDNEETGALKAQTFLDMIDRLWAAMHDLLLRLSNMFRDRRTGIIFLIVNYSHISTTLRSAASGSRSNGSHDGSSSGPAAGAITGGSSSGAASAHSAAAVGAGAASHASGAAPSANSGIGKTGATALKECEDQLHSCTGLYVEDQLSVHFRELVDFVKRAEQQQKRSAVAEGQPIPGFGPTQAAPVLKDFSGRWNAALETMHKEVSKQFEGTSCGRDVLQASMTQLLKYYTRLLELLKKQGPEGQLMAKGAVNLPAIMYEIKRFMR